MIRCCFAVALAAIALVAALAHQSPVHPPARRTLVLAHYMPWFVAKPASPVWGWHWTMNVFDPDKETDGKRPIASHYYPLIGPYDSGDTAVLEYHLLLMKLAGIDGVVADWYGLSDAFDYPVQHRNTAALFQVAGRLGLKCAVCYEDHTVSYLVQTGKLAAGDRVSHATGEIDWLRGHWFADPAYVRVSGRPLLLSFGYDGLTDKEWKQVLPHSATGPLYLSELVRRPAADGAFDWPVPQEYPASVDRFYSAQGKLPIAMPVAFPRFNDIYAGARVHSSYGSIPGDDGRTFTTTLRRAMASSAPLVQIATWNDWGEGTQIEPSRELGYRDLESVQRLRRELVDTAFSGKADDLRLPLRLYHLRRTEAAGRQAGLDRIAALLASGRTAAARSALELLSH